MRKQNIVLLSRKACWKIAKEGRDQYESYLFAKLLASLSPGHPILLNFKSNLTAFRLLTQYSDSRFRYLINSAISYGFIRVEGRHLRLIGKRADKKRFNLNKRVHEPVSADKIKPFFQCSVIEHNLLEQNKQFKIKESAIVKGRRLKDTKVPSDSTINKLCYNKGDINMDITMSCRSAAKLFGTSISSAFYTLRSLNGYGLTITPNIVDISKGEFQYLLRVGKPNIRYSKDTKEYYYIKAQKAAITRKEIHWAA